MTRPLRLLALGAVAAALVLVPSSTTASAASSPSTLSLEATFVTDGLGITTCPPGTPPATDCYAQTGRAPVRGLGVTTIRNSLLVDQSQQGCEHLKIEGTLAAGGEGTVSYTGTSGGRCVQLHLPSTVDYSFVAGGGGFTGAAGSGTITVAFASTRSGDSMKLSWHGALTVPGYSFDTTPPVFSGIRNKHVTVGKRARRARVKYAVTAADGVDGPVRARCRPASGAWFRLGRTTVTCTASDSHANVARASLRVTVKRSG